MAYSRHPFLDLSQCILNVICIRVFLIFMECHIEYCQVWLKRRLIIIHLLSRIHSNVNLIHQFWGIEFSSLNYILK